MPWLPDKKADGGYKFISHVVCRKCGKVIDDSVNILDSHGNYKCPNCGFISKKPVKKKTKYTMMSKKQLLKKHKEYDEAIESGQIDPWLEEQLALINEELEKR